MGAEMSEVPNQDTKSSYSYLAMSGSNRPVTFGLDVLNKWVRITCIHNEVSAQGLREVTRWNIPLVPEEAKGIAKALIHLAKVARGFAEGKGREVTP